MRKFIAALMFAVFATTAHATTYTLTVSTFGPVSLSSVTSSPSGINCGTSCSDTFPAGSTVTLYARSTSTSVFAGWGGEAGCKSNSLTCPVLMNTNRGITAQFNPVLAVSLYGNGGGTVTDASGTVNCSITNSCANGGKIRQAYPKGTQINLTAVADGSSTFAGWTGAGCTSGPCVFNMNTSQVVVATFTSAGPFTIRVSTAGPGKGTITSSPSGINCGSTTTACAVPFAANTSITLTATATTGYAFVGWSNGGCSSTSTCVIISTSAQQSTGGPWSPAAWFY